MNVVDKVALCERIGEKITEKVAARQAELEAELAKLSHYGKPAKKATPAAKAKKTDEPLAAKQPPAAQSEAEAA